MEKRLEDFHYGDSLKITGRENFRLKITDNNDDVGNIGFKDEPEYLMGDLMPVIIRHSWEYGRVMDSDDLAVPCRIVLVEKTLPWGK